jgi:hypothetical protein
MAPKNRWIYKYYCFSDRNAFLETVSLQQKVAAGAPTTSDGPTVVAVLGAEKPQVFQASPGRSSAWC